MSSRGGQLLLQRHIGSLTIVGSEPICSDVLDVIVHSKEILHEPLVPDVAIVAFSVVILMRLSGLGMRDGNFLLLCLRQQHATYEFRASVN